MTVDLEQEAKDAIHKADEALREWTPPRLAWHMVIVIGVACSLLGFIFRISHPVTPNVEAFLVMIASSEGTDRAPDSYRVCYGYKHTIIDLNYHPACPRPPMMEPEWPGESLDSLGPDYKGLISTAAGRYQLTKHTWMALQAKLNLPDFTGPSQDDAAIQLIKEKGALDLLYAGKVSEAITACRGIWASLPGGDSGQPQAKLTDLINVYGNAGGSFA